MKKSLFEYQNYKEFVLDWIASRPKNGRGQLSQIAKLLNISSVSVSYIFSGDRNLSEEQALELSEFLSFTEIESDYFLLLVQYARAGSFKLEQKFLKNLERLKKQAQNLKSRVPEHKEMSENAKAHFYSNWYYSGIRLLTSIPGYQQIDEISQYLNIPKPRVREVLDFLVEYSLCVENQSKFVMGPARTHIDAQSSLVASHHRNWRLKAIENYQHIENDELSFTGPMTLSNDDLIEIRKRLIETIADVSKIVEPSKSECLSCLNIDLFRVKPTR